MKVHNSLSSMLVSLENIKNTSSKMVPSSAYCFHFAQFSIERTVYELCRTVPADPPVHCKIYRHLMSSTWKEYNTEDTHLRAPYGATKPWIYNSNKGKQGSRSKATAYFSACSVPIWLPLSDHRKLLYIYRPNKACRNILCTFTQILKLDPRGETCRTHCLKVEKRHPKTGSYLHRDTFTERLTKVSRTNGCI